MDAARLSDIVRSYLKRRDAAAEKEDRRQFPDCPRPRRFTVAADHGWSEDEEEHLARCPRCQEVLQRLQQSRSTDADEAQHGTEPNTKTPIRLEEALVVLKLLLRPVPVPQLMGYRSQTTGDASEADTWVLFDEEGDDLLDLGSLLSDACYGCQAQQVRFELNAQPSTNVEGAYDWRLRVTPGPPVLSLCVEIGFMESAALLFVVCAGRDTDTVEAQDVCPIEMDSPALRVTIGARDDAGAER